MNVHTVLLLIVKLGNHPNVHKSEWINCGISIQCYTSMIQKQTKKTTIGICNYMNENKQKQG